MPGVYVSTRGDHGEGKVQKYQFPLGFLDTTHAHEIVGELRKHYARERDEMLTHQKQCGAARDVEGAKFFKHEAQHFMKLYRACCLLLPHVANEYPGDCEYRDPYEWGEELFAALDYVAYQVVFQAKFHEADIAQ